jgi:hypothetical protein
VELSSGMEKNHFFAIIHEKLHRGDYLRFGRIIFIGNPNSSSYSHLCIFLSSIKRRIPCGQTGRQRFFGRHLKNPLSCLRPMLRCPREARLSCWKPIASKILLTMSREPFFLRPWQIKSAHLQWLGWHPRANLCPNVAVAAKTFRFSVMVAILSSCSGQCSIESP